MFSLRKKLEMPAPEEALPGRTTPIPTARTHFVNGRPLTKCRSGTGIASVLPGRHSPGAGTTSLSRVNGHISRSLSRIRWHNHLHVGGHPLRANATRPTPDNSSARPCDSRYSCMIEIPIRGTMTGRSNDAADGWGNHCAA